MDKVNVKISREVLEILEEPPSTLEQLGYKSSLALAEKFVDEIVEFAYSLPDKQIYKIPEEFEHHYIRYGNPKFYSFFKRKSSSTTWYIFFKKVEEDKWLVTHISNNWIEGQYIRG